MILDDGAADGKPHPGSVRLGREERFEQPLQPVGRNAGPPIFNTNQDFLEIGVRRADNDAAIGGQASVERFEGVAQQVDQHLLDLHLVDQHYRQLGFTLEVQLNIVQSSVGVQQLDNFLEQHSQVDVGALRQRLLHETLDAANNVSRTFGLLCDLAGPGQDALGGDISRPDCLLASIGVV